MSAVLLGIVVVVLFVAVFQSPEPESRSQVELPAKVALGRESSSNAATNRLGDAERHSGKRPIDFGNGMAAVVFIVLFSTRFVALRLNDREYRFLQCRRIGTRGGV